MKKIIWAPLFLLHRSRDSSADTKRPQGQPRRPTSLWPPLTASRWMATKRTPCWRPSRDLHLIMCLESWTEACRVGLSFCQHCSNFQVDWIYINIGHKQVPAIPQIADYERNLELASRGTWSQRLISKLVLFSCLVKLFFFEKYICHDDVCRKITEENIQNSLIWKKSASSLMKTINFVLLFSGFGFPMSYEPSSSLLLL